MEIQRQELSKFAITSYSPEQLVIGGQTFQDSLVLTPTQIICPWGPSQGHELSLAHWETLPLEDVELIVLGYHAGSLMIPMDVRRFLMAKRIGLESMNLGAACRTYNVLLTEDRKILAIFRLSTNDKK